MKYIVMLGDGMADYPVPELGNRTPLEAAVKPNMDFLAQNGKVGMANRTPPTFRRWAMIPKFITAAVPRLRQSAWGSTSERVM